MKTKIAVLTKEERDILVLAAICNNNKHLTNSEIAQYLGMSVNKVKMTIHQACVKLGARNRNEAIFLAIMIRGEISLHEIYSFDEITEMFSALGSDTYKKIAHLVRQKLNHGRLSGEGEQMICTGRQGTILTRREKEVLGLTSRGLPNEEIADRLCISISAVRTNLYRICTKLGVDKRNDAVHRALRLGEINPGDILSFNELMQAFVPLGVESIKDMAQLLNHKLGQKPISGLGVRN